MLAFGGCNSIMLIVNKMAIRLLPVPSLVLVSQLVVSALFCQAGNAVGVLDNDAFEWGKIRAFFPAVCGFLAALFCNAKARWKRGSRRAVGVCTRLLAALAAGAGACQRGDLHCRSCLIAAPGRRVRLALHGPRASRRPLWCRACHHLSQRARLRAKSYAYAGGRGLVVGLARCICALACLWRGVASSYTCRLQTFDQCYIKHVCDTVPMTSWGRVSYSNALAIVPAILLGAIFQEYGALKGYVMSRHAFIIVLLSCICGVAMSFSAFYLRAQISATAFTVRSGRALVACLAGTKLHACLHRRLWASCVSSSLCCSA